jgi:pimeloyl-ACP methyl ester carboxylesterase
MPKLAREDGVEIAWEQRGEGPAVVLVPHVNAHPSVFEPIIAELERDHRVITYDARGYGRSTRRGPHDMETGAADLAAVAAEAGGAAIALTLADACSRAVRVAAEDPVAVTAVVALGSAPVALAALRDADAVVSSQTVVDAFLDQIETDYRGAIRSLLSAANQQMDEDEVRERVAAQTEYASQEAVVERLRAWAADDPLEHGLAIGDRLWLLASPDIGGWLPPGSELQRLLEPLLPDANFEQVADGIVSRPELTAAVVRRITSGSREGEHSK